MCMPFAMAVFCGKFHFCFLHSKEFLKFAPTLLIVGALFYLTRKLSQGASGKGVSFK